MLYHYTTIPAIKSILRDAIAKEQMCFWATRYDCFADTEEFKIGVETIRRLLPEVEKDMQTDRQIAQMFNWDKIKDNQNLPYPYIVSFTSRPDNDYMWRKYAKEDGVVLAINDTEGVAVPDLPMLRLVSCIYAKSSNENKLTEMLREDYTEIGRRILKGPQKEIAFYMLKESPQAFVKLIATGLLFVTAPRIKRAEEYWMEEETRVIIPLPEPSYNTLIEGYDETILKLGLNPTELRTEIANEHSRQRDDGSVVFYREMHLPIHLLKSVYVRSQTTREELESFMAKSGLNIPVMSL